jgi:hypothetical protein
MRAPLVVAASLLGLELRFHGIPYSQLLERQNHPQNTNDPMLVLDGKPYVTATQRKPW